MMNFEKENFFCKKKPQLFCKKRNNHSKLLSTTACPASPLLPSPLLSSVTFMKDCLPLSDFITCIPFNSHTSPDLFGPCYLLGA